MANEIMCCLAASYIWHLEVIDKQRQFDLMAFTSSTIEKVRYKFDISTVPKLQPDGLAPAFQIPSQAKAISGPSPLAWLGSQSEAGPSTALCLSLYIDLSY